MRFTLALLGALTAVVLAGCGSGSNSSSEASNATKATTGSHLSKLGIEDTALGTGPKVEKGDEVWVKYVGKLANGTIFDQTQPGADPLHVTVGAGQVIKGWDQGLVGIQKGGKRKLSIPYALAYGDRGQGEKIPAQSDLYFDVEATDVLQAKDADQIVATDVKQGSGREVKAGDTVTVDYDASVNGAVVESTKTGGKHFTFKIGGDNVTIKGFDDALVGMKVGGERKITIPPGLTMTVPSDDMRMHIVTFDVHMIAIK
ncbi:MAG: FKBP-type peptidyl-prolyl cis-trans isomerase [Fimbriimonas sp.]|nr:FKBP-type peptidyl-prolyl cis-trans isomerase [Fimbriimonas sp.]